MKCYYSNRECKECKKKQHCTIIIAYLNEKQKNYKLQEKIGMIQEPPEREEDFNP